MKPNRSSCRAPSLSVVVVLVVLALVAFCLGGAGLQAAPVKSGFAERDISPEIGMVLPGEYDHVDALVQDLAYEQSSNPDRCSRESPSRRFAAPWNYGNVPPEPE